MKVALFVALAFFCSLWTTGKFLAPNCTLQSGCRLLITKLKLISRKIVSYLLVQVQSCCRLDFTLSATMYLFSRDLLTNASSLKGIVRTMHV